MNTNLVGDEKDVETITLNKLVFIDLLNDSMLLGCLEAVGVDGWDGYDVAAEMAVEMMEDE